ncbi:uncharacterized protein LOC111518898 [Drosophila willistoni]|uniref:uncharacterized protein LOC111518898 n=1 Tax=Drosophila willistoni TaxID=7260 RepID=UPI000C26CF05|nr:uncharacterized protein LOC111518898 [Drosophila willistoni]
MDPITNTTEHRGSGDAGNKPKKLTPMERVKLYRLMRTLTLQHAQKKWERKQLNYQLSCLEEEAEGNEPIMQRQRKLKNQLYYTMVKMHRLKKDFFLIKKIVI